MGLAFYNPAPGLGVTVHDEVTQFVCDVEALAVVIPLDRVKDHDRAQSTVERVSVNRGGLWRTEHHQNPVILQQPHKVASRSRLNPPRLPKKARGPLRAVAILVIHGYWKARHVSMGKLDVSLQARCDVHGELPVGERLIARQLTG